MCHRKYTQRAHTFYFSSLYRFQRRRGMRETGKLTWRGWFRGLWLTHCTGRRRWRCPGSMSSARLETFACWCGWSCTRVPSCTPPSSSLLWKMETRRETSAGCCNYAYPIGPSRGYGIVTCYRQYLRVRRPAIFTRAWPAATLRAPQRRDSCFAASRDNRSIIHTRNECEHACWTMALLPRC